MTLFATTLNGVPPFPDDADRARLREDLDATLVVEAGAGTGKTTALVGRILALVASGRAALREIAAITFTDAAAAELRERLLGELRDRADPGLGASVAEVEEAAISTIHGFAQRLLAEHSLEAGLPPRFEVLDELSASLEREHRLAALNERLFADPSAQSLLAAAHLLGIGTDHLRRLGRLFEEEWENVTSLASAPDAGSAESLGRLLGSHVAEVLESAVAAGPWRPLCGDPEDDLLARLDEVALATKRGAGLRDPLEQLEWLVGLRQQRPGRAGRKPAWPDGAREEARAALAAFEQRRADAMAAAYGAVLQGLGRRLAAAAQVAAADRRRRGELTFHDLLVHARDLLQRQARVRHLAQARYRYLLVDEFQDTDPLQLELLLLLGGRDDGGVRPGSLFFVGDPRQSIYRFRGADVALYERALAELVGEDRARLRTNFRSDPGILDWVNGVFGELFGGKESTRLPFGGLAPARPAGSRPPVLVVGGALEGPLPAAERRRLEAEAVAGTIARALDEGWEVREDEIPRPARPGDIAVLIPRRTGLGELEAALERRGLPYTVESTALLFQAPEVTDLLACLRAIDRPGDELAVVAALRTAPLGCADDELLAYRQAGGEWRLDAAVPEGFVGHPVPTALAVLARHRARLHRRGAAGTVAALVHEERLLPLAAGRRRARESLRRLHHVLDRARAFAEAGGVELGELLEWFALEAEAGARGVEPPGDLGEDTVRILTVHGAKGLEFPIVLLAELGGAPRPAVAGPGLLRAPDGAIELRLGARRETPGFAALAEAEKDLALAEQLRLAYVAATRARDHLVVVGQHVPAGSDPACSLAELLLAAAEAAGVSQETEAMPPSEPSRPVVVSARPLSGGPGAKEETTLAWQAERSRVLAHAARARHVAATDLAGEDARGWREQSPARLDDEEPDSLGRGRRRGASRLGRAVHATLEAVELVAGADLERCAVVAAASEGCSESVARVRELAAAALASPTVAQAARAERRWRELPVAVEVGETVLEAVVDLCFVEEDGLVVVDYKTDALADEGQVPGAAARYRHQAGAYALALEQSLGRPVRRFVFLFLALPGRAVECEAVDLWGAVAEVRARIGEGGPPAEGLT